MGARLNDTATVLVPARVNDQFTDEPGPIDWKQDPTQVAVPFQGQPIPMRSSNVDEDTTLTKWRGYLPPRIEVDAALVETLTVVDTGCRIRWHGSDYAIDGAIGQHYRRGRLRYLSLTLRRV